jgi:hypothetical protein
MISNSLLVKIVLDKNGKKEILYSFADLKMAKGTPSITLWYVVFFDHLLRLSMGQI